jgi:acid phosphatase type 7
LYTADYGYDANAELVINGHDHNYERFAPQDPSGHADAARGIREFVVGTGGKNTRPMGATKPNSKTRNAYTFGILKLTLHPTGYEWEFIPVSGKTFRDSGSGKCH